MSAVLTTHLGEAFGLLQSWRMREVRVTSFTSDGADTVRIRGMFTPDFFELRDGDEHLLELGVNLAYGYREVPAAMMASDFQCLSGDLRAGMLAVLGWEWGWAHVERLPHNQLLIPGLD
jgi:hypothetical protein